MDDRSWEDLKERFMEHFPSAEADGGALLYSSGSASLEVRRSGEVEAEMPLHGFRAGDFDRIEFRGDRVEVESGEVTYEFRK